MSGHPEWRSLIRWMKLNLVGCVGIGVQLSTLWMLTSMRFSYIIATALAVEAAVLHNFVWHERFTWADCTDGSLIDSFGRLVRFNLTTGLVSILGNLLLMRLLVGGSHLKPIIANVVSIAICSLANFIVSDRWVFRAAPAE